MLMQPKTVTGTTFDAIALAGQFNTFFRDRQTNPSMFRLICFAQDSEEWGGDPERVLEHIVEFAGS